MRVQEYEVRKISKRAWFYDCGIVFECYSMDDFGNLVRIQPEMFAFHLAQSRSVQEEAPSL